MNIIKASILLVCLFLWMNDLSANNQCENIWEEFLKTSIEAQYSKANAWSKERSKCPDKAFHVLKHTWLLINESRFSEAKSILQATLTELGGSNEEVELALATLPFQEGANKNEVDNNLIKESLNLLQKHSLKYPNSGQAFAQMSGAYLVLNDFDRAIEYGEKAVAISDDFFAYRNLAIASYQVEQDAKSIYYSDKAIEINSSALSDRDLGLSRALSYSALKDFKNALETLQLMVQTNSSIQSDHEFQRVVRYIRGEYIKFENQRLNANQ
jgi:tetratricopeptide (TPR) repeat protein